jgi:hypothetical protein
MRKLLALLVLAAVLGPAAARADGKIVLNARAGVAAPLGEIGDGAKLGDLVGWAFPLQADLQFRFWKQLSLGAYGRYAPATLESEVSNACSTRGVSCDASDVAFGAVGEYRFSERLEGGPWIGGHVGWEMLRFDRAVTAGEASVTDSGLEAGAQAGYDFELGGLTLGPYGGLGLGQFSRTSQKVGGVKTSRDISDTAVHGWLQVGLRASLLL